MAANRRRLRSVCKFPFVRNAQVMIALVCLSVVSGCQPKSDLAPVRGKVLFNGQPLKFGSVMFQPEFGQPARSIIRSDGSFELWTEIEGDGARIGKNEVRVTCFEGQRPAVNHGEGEPALGKSLIPMKYTSFAHSGLTYVVQPSGHPDVVLELKDEEVE